MNGVPTAWTTPERVALLVVTVVGMAMCSAAVGRVAAAGRWLSPPGVAGTVLGVLVLGVVAARLLGRPLPIVDSDRAALVAVVAVIALKVAIGRLLPIVG